MTELGSPPARKPRGGAALDRRGWVELAITFLVTAVLFSLLSIDLVQSLLDDPGYRSRTILLGVGIGAAIALGLAALQHWGWRRAPGRPAQRLGRRAWRDGRLPPTDPERALVLADLQRRQQVLTTGIPPIVLAGVWAVVGALQLLKFDSWLHTIGWVLLTGLFVTVGVHGALDRRRLPQLRGLLEQVPLDQRHAALDETPPANP